VILPACLTLTALLAFQQGSQDSVTLTRLPSTVRQGQVIAATLRVETQKPVEAPRIPKVEGLHIRVGRPTRGSSMTIINGRQTVSHEVTYPIEVVGIALGKFKIPPIEIKVGDQVYRTPERVLEVVKNITGKNFGTLTIVPSKTRVYVHEPIRFDIECAVDASLDIANGRAPNGAQYYSVRLEAEWLSKMDGGEVMDVPDTDTDRRVNVVLNQMLQPADVSVVRGSDGKSQTVFRYHKSILPTRVGKNRLIAPLMRFAVLQGQGRDPFGFPTRNQKEYIVAEKPIEIEVLPLPTEDRPDPFFGAVGRFTIKAEFDKRVVSVGGSVKLVLTIEGTGNMEHLRVPELTDIPGFHGLGKIENRTRDSVAITYDLTPKTAEVDSVAAIAWNYFDTTPGVERYIEVKTEPLVIEVRARAGEESLSELPGEKPKAVEAGVDDIYDVKLASGTDTARLAPSPGTGTTLLSSLLPWVVCVLGMFFWRARRRAMADVQGRRARGALRKFQGAISSGTDPLDALIAYLADRFGCEPAAVIGQDLADRLTAVGIGDVRAADVQGLVDDGVASRYGGGGGVDQDRVVAAVEALERGEPVGSVTAGLLLALIPATLFGARLGAQDLSAAEQAYRDRDYVAAAEAFAKAADAGDRRAAYNLGNSFYRQGLFARALAAYERARLAMPRDPELLANIRLSRERLNLGTAEGEAFAQTVAAIRDSYTPRERFWMCVLCNALAAALVCFGGRRLRMLGGVIAVPALILLVEVAVLQPQRPLKGIVVEPGTKVRAEPSADLEHILTVRAGVAVEVLGTGSGSKWTQVRVEGRKGFAPSRALVVIE
jgi:hypothetical protein